MLSFFPLHRSTLAALAYAVAAGALLLVFGCEAPTVDVLQPSDRYRYSLFGALNVAADTQVIRVDKIGSPTQVGAAPDLDVRVVLRDRSSGEEIPLRDSLTTVVFDSTQMYNFWTTYPIQPGRAYQVAVTKDGTDLTTATTTTPANPPDLSLGLAFYLPCDTMPVLEAGLRAANTYEVVVRNVENVAAAKVYYPLLNPEGEDTLRTWPSRDHYEDVTEQDGHFNISVYYLPELRNLNPLSPTASNCPPRSLFFRSAARMVVAAGGPQWPVWRNASLDDLARPDRFSNVEGGHGFVGGVYTDTIQVPIERRPPGF